MDAATNVATYEFTNTLAPDSGSSAPSLTPVDPLAQNAYLVESDVFGKSDTVYRFSGTSSDNAGLSLNTTNLVMANSYSVEMVFSLDLASGWRRVIDVQDRQVDSGFYVDLDNHLTIFPTSGSGPNSFAPGYHHVIMTVASDGTVKGYIDGLSDLTVNTTLMNLSNSASNTMNFFLDNVAGRAQGEYSSGKIAQLRLYDGVLTDEEALTLSQTPLVPEPTVPMLFISAGLTLATRRRRATR